MNQGTYPFAFSEKGAAATCLAKFITLANSFQEIGLESVLQGKFLQITIGVWSEGTGFKVTFRADMNETPTG